MSTREELLYAKMVAAGETESIDRVFFFPTKIDATIAKKWLERGIVTPNNRGTLHSALSMVSRREAVPLRYLQIVRNLEKDTT